ncbi:MAG: TlpA family protein disulfide reductase [Gemmatimonadota bacterium]|nr:TlpA family protein disulfide reductase [Gemmatimonadota bacterium]MDH5197254.1 TlpA family protein disulfide reductase [Gemmatimonadota bacterium]
MFRRSRAHVLTLLALAVLPGGLHAQDQIGLALGSMPEAVTVEDLDGNAVDLGQWIGKTPVVFQFWATWCPVCEALAPKVQAARATHADTVQFVMVAVGVNQSPRRVRRYLEQHPDMGPVVWDGKGAAVRAFEAPGTSYVVALDASGKVVYTGFGADQDIAGAFTAATK